MKVNYFILALLAYVGSTQAIRETVNKDASKKARDAKARIQQEQQARQQADREKKYYEFLKRIQADHPIDVNDLEIMDLEGIYPSLEITPEIILAASMPGQEEIIIFEDVSERDLMSPNTKAALAKVLEPSEQKDAPGPIKSQKRNDNRVNPAAAPVRKSQRLQEKTENKMQQ